MTIAYLNNTFLPLEEARISPMDRGFLFGDGIYEVIPSYSGHMVGCDLHLQRMQNGLAELDIHCALTSADWRNLCEQLIERNGGGNLGIYLQISRGASEKRFHGWDGTLTPSLFGYAFPIPAPPCAETLNASCYSVTTDIDRRWRRCHIKSTALLGNVLHFQHGNAQGFQETLLFNERDELTEAAACNVFIVNDGAIATPPLDHQILPGITRHILLDVLRKESELPVDERVITRAEVMSADEVWLTSSSKELAPIIAIDQHIVGTGAPGPIWKQAQTLYTAGKKNYL